MFESTHVEYQTGWSLDLHNHHKMWLHVVDFLCKKCGEADETAQHIIFYCPALSKKRVVSLCAPWSWGQIGEQDKNHPKYQYKLIFLSLFIVYNYLVEKNVNKRWTELYVENFCSEKWARRPTFRLMNRHYRLFTEG